MMREIFERFRYRFELWRREQRQDSLGPRDTSHYRDPRNIAIITESRSRFAVRVAITFFGCVAIIGISIYGVMAAFWPAARHIADIIMVIVGAIWILGIGFTVLDMCIARRKHRDAATKI
jgi:hypothetical protein